MMSNTGASGAAVGSTTADVEFSCFDRLPVVLRRKLADAPVKILASSLLPYYHAHGENQALAVIDQIAEQARVYV